jgi:ATP phosphoribosyltransferase
MDKLDEILNNTQEIKAVVVKRKKTQEKKEQEKKDKRKEQVKQAQQKFKQIKTNINQELQDKVSLRVQELGTNTSAYIQTLIKKDLTKSNNLDLESIKNLSLFEFIKLKYL